MNGIHDVGGMHGLEPIEIEPEEPVFHAEWERRVFAAFLALAVDGVYNLDEFRHGIERMHPAHYLSSSYYEHWLETMERNLLRAGRVTREELDLLAEPFRADPDRHATERRDPVIAEKLVAVISAGGWTDEAVDARPRYAVGDHVRTHNFIHEGHTRLPRYARAKSGVITAVYPSLIFPDTNSQRRGTNPQYVYNVEFAAQELWGDDAEPNMTLSLDLWESYLAPVAMPNTTGG
jgi:nitrile hydratase subunit beta